METLDDSELRAYFLEHLDRVYEVKMDVVKKLPSIADHADFRDLQYAINETIEDVERQIENMIKIYKEIGASFKPKPHETSTGMVDDLFDAIVRRAKDRTMRDLSILFYMQNMESIEVCSFKILQIIADKLGNHKIIQLLRENADMAHDDRDLFSEINKQYVVKGE